MRVRGIFQVWIASQPFVNIVPLLNDIDDALVPLNFAPIKVKNSIYEWLPVDSKIEEAFAGGLDQRHLTFKLFKALPQLHRANAGRGVSARLRHCQTR
jgi:hypothetical protein